MYTFTTEFACARELDRLDPLAGVRQRFYTQEGQIYMDGNSLGLCSKDAEQAVMDALADWKRLGIGVWSNPDKNYFLYQDILGAKIAPLINARPEEVTPRSGIRSLLTN